MFAMICRGSTPSLRVWGAVSHEKVTVSREFNHVTVVSTSFPVGTDATPWQPRNPQTLETTL